MNKKSKELLALARHNVKQFITPRLLAACVTGSAAKGYADETSDIDTLLFFKEKFTEEDFNFFVQQARDTGGDLHLGDAEHGFALYHKIDGMICDFAFIYSKDTEDMFNDVIDKADTTPIVHLQISGIVEGADLYGSEWIDSLRNIASKYPRELQVNIVKQHLRFHPSWVLQQMGYDRNDVLFANEIISGAVDNMTRVLCGINKMFLPGKLKGLDHTVNKMKIKPVEFVKRYRKVYELNGEKSVKELYELIEETILLAEKHLPGVSTERTRKVLSIPAPGVENGA